VSPAPRRGRGRRVIAILGWMVLVLASLAVVTWRQTVGVSREHALRATQAERAIVDAEQMELERRIQALSTRTRVVRVARERLGLHLPGDDEIVLLPIEADSASVFTATGGGRR